MVGVPPVGDTVLPPTTLFVLVRTCENSVRCSCGNGLNDSVSYIRTVCWFKHPTISLLNEDMKGVVVLCEPGCRRDAIYGAEIYGTAPTVETSTSLYGVIVNVSGSFFWGKAKGVNLHPATQGRLYFLPLAGGLSFVLREVVSAPTKCKPGYLNVRHC